MGKLIKVKVFPGSKMGEVIKKAENTFEERVKAKPVRGEATKETVIALAIYFNVPASTVRLIKGFKQRNKIFEIAIH